MGIETIYPIFTWRIIWVGGILTNAGRRMVVGHSARGTASVEAILLRPYFSGNIIRSAPYFCKKPGERLKAYERWYRKTEVIFWTDPTEPKTTGGKKINTPPSHPRTPAVREPAPKRVSSQSVEEQKEAEAIVAASVRQLGALGYLTTPGEMANDASVYYEDNRLYFHPKLGKASNDTSQISSHRILNR